MANGVYGGIEELTLQAQENGSSVTKQDVMNVVKLHSAGSAAAMVAAGALSGTGSMIASVIEIGLVWTMYGRVCRKLGVDLKKDLMKALSSAFTVNFLIAQVAQIISETIVTAASDIGSMGAAGVNALMGYGLTYASAILFVNLLVRVFKVGTKQED